jgi:hypothetical protein
MTATVRWTGRSSRLQQIAHPGGRQPNEEGRTVSTARLGPKTATVGFNDRSTDRQSHSHAVRLCREEGLEEVRHVLLIDANARILYADLYLVTITQPRADLLRGQKCQANRRCIVDKLQFERSRMIARGPLCYACHRAHLCTRSNEPTFRRDRARPLHVVVPALQAYDDAEQVIGGEDLPGPSPSSWLCHRMPDAASDFPHNRPGGGLK